MKPEADNRGKIHVSRRIICFPAFFVICGLSYSQVTTTIDSLRKTSVDIVPSILHNIKIILTESTDSQPYDPIPPVDRENNRTTIFLDSLKNRASRTLITRKLYDFVIIRQEPEAVKKITGPSNASFLDYSGMKIRTITIKQLNVFGSNINSPDFYDPNKLEKLLNKTHINTNENIIRKNLLFTEGDTISPLTFSDNERLIRSLPYIDDARILIVPVSEAEADIIVITKDIYSLGANTSFNGLDKGSVSVYEKNIFGMGHEFGITVPYDSEYSDSPGLGVNYTVNNIMKTFSNLNIFYYDGLGKKTYGFDLVRDLVSSATKYAGGISIRQMFTSYDLESLSEPEPVKYNLQDYWFARSFLLNRESVTRIILGARYTNKNVFDHPYILPDSYHQLQKYKMYLGSASFSMQKFYKANLIYSYGRTEDIPYGALLNFTMGKEISEFKSRYYFASSLSVGESVSSLGYFYSTAAFGTFFNEGETEQGILSFSTNFISNLSYLGRYKIRNFVHADYTRGFDRYSDERLIFTSENGFSGFRNDSTGNNQRLKISLESVLFSPVNFYGFRFALFGFADIGFLFGTNEFVGSGDSLSAIGLGIRIRNNNLVLNTLQIRLGFFPNIPDYSRINHLLVSGEQLLRPYKFEPGPPSLLSYK
jgi:hypothetical protein